MSVKAIKKARENKDRDQFAVGTVIRWLASGRYQYAALKTDIGWFTTSRYGNQFVPQTISFEDLLDVLARNETTEVMVATPEDFRSIDGDE